MVIARAVMVPLGKHPEKDDQTFVCIGDSSLRKRILFNKPISFVTKLQVKEKSLICLLVFGYLRVTSSLLLMDDSSTA